MFSLSKGIVSDGEVKRMFLFLSEIKNKCPKQLWFGHFLTPKYFSIVPVAGVYV